MIFSKIPLMFCTVIGQSYTCHTTQKSLYLPPIGLATFDKITYVIENEDKKYIGCLVRYSEPRDIAREVSSLTCESVIKNLSK